MIAKPNWKLITLLAALALTVAHPSWARPERHGVRGGGGIPKAALPRTAHPRGLLGQLIFPCPAACATAAESCHETAKDEALSCITGACASEIAAAQTACAADRTSDACEEAVDALDACADPCLDANAAAVDTCRDTLIDCRDACTSDE